MQKISRDTVTQDLMADLIGKIRRREGDYYKNFDALNWVVTDYTDDICAKLDSRWLVAVCDTYADYGTDIERANAMIITTFINTIKFMWTAELMTEQMMDSSYQAVVKHSNVLELRKNHNLYDGIRTLGLNKERGNASYNMFRRINNSLLPTPHLQKIFHTLIKRIKKCPYHPLVRLHDKHGNFFKHSLNEEFIQTPTDRYEA